MNNAQILAKSFADLGVKRVFGFSGATILPVFHALAELGIDIVVDANEQSCAFAAGLSVHDGPRALLHPIARVLIFQESS